MGIGSIIKDIAIINTSPQNHPKKSEPCNRMASIKNLAGQTIWYGVSTIAAQMINFLQNPILTYLLNDGRGRERFGEISFLYAIIPFANVIFTYGMTTAFFRFNNKTTDKDQ